MTPNKPGDGGPKSPLSLTRQPSGTGGKLSLTRPGGSGKLGVRSAGPGGLIRQGGSEAAQRLSGTSGSSPHALAALRQQGAAIQHHEAAQAAAQQLTAALKDARRQFTAKLAVLMDYTASSIGDIPDFRREAQGLVDELNERFGEVHVLPVAVRGNDDYSQPEAVVGDVDDLTFFEGVSNRGYNNGSPFGVGLEAVIESGFFDGEPSSHEERTIVMIGDDVLTGVAQATLNRFEQMGVTVMALVQPTGKSGAVGSGNPRATMRSYIRPVTETFGDRGIVVERERHQQELGAAPLIGGAITCRIDNEARLIAAQQIQQTTGTPVPAEATTRISFADFLTQEGHALTAGRVTQGRMLEDKGK